MYPRKLIVYRLLFLFLLFEAVFFYCFGKDDNNFKFGPLYPPHDRFIISDFDAFAIHYCGLKGSVFLMAHCIFHGLIDTLKQREVVYEDYEKIIELLLQRKNYNSSTKLLFSKNGCENNIVPYTPLTKSKSITIKGIKISSSVEDFCKFSARCMNNNPKTLIKDNTSRQQEYFEKWFKICKGNDGTLDALFASRIDFQISKLKLKQMESKELCEIGAKISNESPDQRVSACIKLIKSEEICSSVSPYKLGFTGWFQQPLDPLKNTPFKFDPKTMIDEKTKKIISIQINSELPPYCIPQEIFSFKPSLQTKIEQRSLLLYVELTQEEKFLINQFLMHFVTNYGKIPRIIFDNRARFAIEGWLLHKNKFPIISTHNAMYSIGRKIQYKDNKSEVYGNSNSKSGAYPYNLPQFSIFSVYSEKTHNFVISDTNPLISPCLKEGCAYFIGRSIDMSPVIVIRAQNTLSIKSFKQSSASFISMFMMSFAEQYLFYPGKVETIDIIIDCRGLSSNNIPTLLKIRPIVKYWQEEGIINMYPLRFNNIFIIQSSEIWGSLKDILGRFWLNETLKRVQVINNVSQNPKSEDELRNLKLLWRYMSPYIIETDMGGVRTRLESGQFYPFKILPGPFKPLNLDFIKSDTIPSLSDWPKPDFNSPKNLYKLIPPELFSNKEKTLDGNEKVSYVDLSKSQQLLKVLPQKLRPVQDVLNSQSENKEDDSSKPSEQSTTASNLIAENKNLKDESMKIDDSEDRNINLDKKVLDSSNFGSKLKYFGDRKNMLLQIYFIQKMLADIKQIYLLRLRRNEIKYILSEQCLRLTSNHIIFFSNLIKRIFNELLEKITNSKKRKKYSNKELLDNRRSIIEVYIDIISTLKLKEARDLLLNNITSDIRLFEMELRKSEVNINKIKKKILIINSGASNPTDNEVMLILNSFNDILNQLNKIGNSILVTETKIKQFNRKMEQQCIYLLSVMDITKSFIEHYNKYDFDNMIESSLLLSMINSIIK